MLIQCRMDAPIRPIDKMRFEDLWHGVDRGILISFERGQQLAIEKPELAKAALSHELPILPWQGGVDGPLKTGEKTGCIYYYAMWHGLCNRNVDIDTMQTYTLTCSKFGVTVTYPPLP